MFAQTKALRRVDERGPRWAVYGTIRAGEARTEYAATSEDAEKLRTEFQTELGYRAVKVHPPVDGVDLAALGRNRAAAKERLDEATAILRAGVLCTKEQDPTRTEVELARTAGVDRMTIRAWLGKQ